MVVAIGVVVLLALPAVTPGVLAPHSLDEQTTKGPNDVRLVSPNDRSDVKIWPFTSRRRTFESLTLPINAVVRGSASRVSAQLRYRTDGQWEQTSEEWQGVDDESEPLLVRGTDVTWQQTTGATRYTYVSAPGDAGGWTTETAQLHDGDYFGSRYHLRLYEVQGTERTWTAIQAHHEHWDWFRLRHTVGSLALAQHHLETEYFSTPYTVDVNRQRFANGGISDFDGWASVVELRPLSSLSVPFIGLLVFGFVDSRRTTSGVRRAAVQIRSWLSTNLGQRSFALFLSLATLPFFVRTAGVVAETGIDFLPVKLVAGVLYLTLVVGIPALALAFPRGGEPFDWAAIAIFGLGIGFIVDYQSIGIDVLPIAVVVHRLAALAVVGFLAATASKSSTTLQWNRPLAVGLSSWLCILAWPLFIGL